MHFMRKICLLIILTCSCFLFNYEYVSAQSDSIQVIDYSDPKEYEIGMVKVYGANYSDDNAIIAIAGFKVGDKLRIPGPEITRAMRALWKLRLFTDVQIRIEKTIGEIVFLEILVEELPRLARHSFKGVKKSDHDDLNEALEPFLIKGGIVTKNTKTNAIVTIQEYYKEKGFLDTKVVIDEVPDEKMVNAVRLTFNIDRNEKVKIKSITFSGNNSVSSRKLRKKLDDTHEKKKLFKSSRFIREDYEEDKRQVVDFYNSLGYRDAIILKDSIWRDADGLVNIHINIKEGNQYYFRNIAWKGNTIYNTDYLSTVLGIQRGDVFNQELLDTRLRFSVDGRDISTLYLDNGYLFFNVDAIETAVVEDSIDLEIRILEGAQATIDKVIIRGNDRTHEHVIRRELRTRPGQKFSRSDIIRSQRQIIALGYFNPETMQINTPVNPQRGTVDIEYVVEEKPSDQLELSAGWAGGGRGVIGTLGVSFNNFSIRNIFNKESWAPLPQGDGQRLSIRAQTSGRFFQSYNVSFTEPWLGGKKPTSFTVGGFYTKLTRGVRETSSYELFDVIGVNVGLGTRMKWPDDNFISNTTFEFQQLRLDNWFGGLFRDDNGNLVQDGIFYDFNIRQTFTRTTIGDPLFPKEGSKISLTMQFTPPYSLFSNKNYSELEAAEKFKWIEYQKFRIDAEWYTQLFGKFVLKTSAKIGILGSYNEEIGVSPFERFQLGGDGLTGQQFANNFVGVDLISLRGYEVRDIPNNFVEVNGTLQETATPIFDKFTLELRYPISLNPSATIYVHAFAQGGNSWQRIEDFNPFDMRRSAGMGLRVFLPMFGTLGFDYGFGFDKPDSGQGNIFQRFGNFNIVLGFEPD